MKQVDETEFREFLNGKLYTRIQGEIFHSVYYIDLDNIKIAYMETSSWGAPDLYMINNEIAISK